MISRSALCLLAGALSAAAVVPPAPPVAAAATPVAAAATPETAGFHLKNRSAFVSAETTRPPFWPIGWTKQFGQAAPVAAAAAIDLKIDPEQYAVTSILLGRPSLAVINGRSYAEGDFIRGPRAKGAPPSTAKVQIGRISDGSVLLTASGQAVSVPLRRPQLTEHKTDDTLSNDR